MKTKKITLDQARWETVPEAYRRAEDVTDESIYERLKDVHEMMLQEDKKAEKADDDMEEIIQDSITYGPDDDLRYDMFTIDMDLINPWLRRNKGYLIRYLEGLQ